MVDQTPIAQHRLPRWVYDGGSEPDVRFSFANERTFLAWLRTALAFIAAGIALDSLPLALPGLIQASLAVVTIALGVLCAATSWIRWALAERSLRHGRPLPALGPALGIPLAAGITLSGLVFAAVAHRG